jgi:hypothetical protein
MITDDEVMRLFERADPARSYDADSVIDVTDSLNALRTRSNNAMTIETTRTPNDLTSRHRPRISRSVAAAVALVIVGGLSLVARGNGPESMTDQTPAAIDAADTPADTAAEEVAMGFVEAYGAFDVDKAITYLADDADVSQLMTSVGAKGVEGTVEEFQLLSSWLEAVDYEQLLDSCAEQRSSASGSEVRCTFDFHLLGSAELGLGPFGVSYFDLTVLGGEIVRASTQWATEQLSPQAWEPFATWVSTAYPDDAAVMYADDTYSGIRLTAESIRLWEQHSQEYVTVKAAEMVETAESFMRARNAGDTETAMSLLADDGVTVELLHDNTIDDDMPQIELTPDEVVIAFEAERLFDVSFESVACEKDPGPYVACVYLLDTRLRQISGYPPVRSSVELRIEDGRINLLNFPWLNMSFPGYAPAEFGEFVRWLGDENPVAIVDLFRIGGQEMILILTEESVDLLEALLDDYERSIE